MPIDVCIADIGCAGGIHKRWSSPVLRVRAHLFDPLMEDQRDILSIPAGGLIVQAERIAIWNECTTHQFYFCAEPSVSSLLQPNSQMLLEYPFPKRYDVVEVATVRTSTLDTALQGVDVDYVKIDAQGASLQILEGAERCLASAAAVEVEVDFIELYRGESAFSQIHSSLTRCGFELWDLERVHWRKLAARSGKGRIAWANALYRRGNVTLSPHKLIPAIGICLAYEHFDEALRLAGNIPGAASDDIRDAIDKAIGSTPLSSWRDADET